MTKEQLQTAMAMLDAHSEEHRRQHLELTHSLDKAIRRVKVQLWMWAIVIAASTFMIVETNLSLIN